MTSIRTPSLWEASTLFPTFPNLDRDLRVDVVVIGAGLTGITAAYLLKRAGRRVVLLDRGRCAVADTGNTTAHLTCALDTPMTDLVASFGEDHARAAWDAGLAAIARFDEIVRTERIDCHFAWVPGYLHAPRLAAQTDEAVEKLRREARQIAALGFDARFRAQVPFVDRPGVEISGQARFHPRRYLSALVAVVDGDGSYVFEETGAEEVRDGSPLSVRAGERVIGCDHIVVATHSPIVGKAGFVSATFLQTKLSLYTSYAVAARVPTGRVPDALYWDTSDPYFYLRLERSGDATDVIFGGEDHKTGQAADTRRCFAGLERRLKEFLPDADITWRWSGQVIETIDGLPFIGEVAPRQFAATGFSGNGMTFGTLAAMMATDAITGLQNPWSELFDMGRTKIKGGTWDYLNENKDYPYYLIRDRFAGADKRSVRSIPRGTGSIVDVGGRRAAAYRADGGSIVLRSPICTHMGCQVRWSTAERTWDCPCHGSRFAPDGRVLAGPAESPLEEMEIKSP